jgi:hypothetical protein
MKTSWSRLLATLWAALSVSMLAPAAFGQTRDEYGEVAQQTVARISYLMGQVSFSRGDDPDNWQPADRNVPMTLGDRVYTGTRSRLELQVHGGTYIRLAARSGLSALNLTEETKQFSVQVGVASFRIRRLDEQETFEVDTPNAAVTFERPGDYRVEVDDRGNTRISVRRGAATAAAGGGQITLNAGEMIDVDGIDAPRYDIVALGPPDGWDQWVNAREDRIDRTRSYRYVSADIVGVDDLDEYGRWEDVPQYGNCWTPTQVAVDWVPYRAGHWMWQDPWGWTWVSSEPWGWAPYHYGRWAFVRSRWYWVPVAPSVRVVAYSPALVGFVGGGPGWSASISFGGGGGFVGWFPLAPRDPLVPWWGSRASVQTNVTNVTYVNKTYVTVVNQNTFVSGGIVTNNIVRDRAVVSQVEAAPVHGGAIPAVPTRAALRVAARQDVAAAPPPPAAIVSRAVVARVAPPPAPPTFQAKAEVIRENRGAPVAPAAAARMSVENRGRPQATNPVRPVAEAGRVTLQPKAETPQTAGRRPEPVTAFRGRPMATADKPVAAAPVTGPTGPAGAPAREIRGRESQPPATGQPAPQAAPPSREVRPRESRPPEAGQPAPERQRQAAPPPPAAPAQPAERGRPQGEEWRMRPTQPPSPETIQRGRVAPQQQQQQQQAPPQQNAPPPRVERQRVQPTQPPQQPPPAREERRVVPPPQQQQQPPQQNAPPPRVERRREQPTQPPQQPQAQPREERGRVAPQPAPQQQQPPPPGQQQRQAPPPPPQGENRPQVQRGERQAQPPAQKGQEKQDQKDKEKKKDEKKSDQ